MIRRTIGIVDYGIGNFSSVRQTLHVLGYRCRVSRDPIVLDKTDLIILPGVGAFPIAMANLHRHGLDDYVQQQARDGKPIVGLCLGAQVLVDTSAEHRLTAGLGLIPGLVEPLSGARWHIGWNTIEVIGDSSLIRASDGKSFYFNHSYRLNVPDDYQICLTRLDEPFVSGIKRGNVVGLQFHPEKSQQAGRELLAHVIEGLCNA